MSSRHLRLFATVVALGWAGVAIVIAMFVLNYSPSETSDLSAPNPAVAPRERLAP